MTPLLLLCLLNLEDPALRVDQEVQDGLSPQQGQSLQLGPEMLHMSDRHVIHKSRVVGVNPGLARFESPGIKTNETFIYFNVDTLRGLETREGRQSVCQSLQGSLDFNVELTVTNSSGNTSS